jgi:hypothetical protein
MLIIVTFILLGFLTAATSCILKRKDDSACYTQKDTFISGAAGAFLPFEKNGQRTPQGKIEFV